jgi:hypothetical protein
VSHVANRRKLIEAAQALAKTSQPTEAHYHALTTAFAQVFTDDTGFKCECVIRLAAQQAGEGARK